MISTELEAGPGGAGHGMAWQGMAWHGGGVTCPIESSRGCTKDARRKTPDARQNENRRVRTRKQGTKETGKTKGQGTSPNSKKKKNQKKSINCEHAQETRDKRHEARDTRDRRRETVE